jgi:hypothetical protein
MAYCKEQDIRLTRIRECSNNFLITTDPIYFKPLLPVITIKNSANNATLYTYNSFTDSGTTDKVIFCSVKLSQNTHGEFTVQFEDVNKSLESTVTVGSRVQIDCGKQSSSLIRLISGLVRKKGYSRGANNKVLYTIQGTSTGIRLNERVTYQKSEAAKLPTGQYDVTDASRKADTLLASSLVGLTADGILSIANLAANSDVETFITSLSIEYGEFQDLVNYIEDQSGGELIVDTNDLVHFRHEIKNNLFGRGFTIKNSRTNAANDDADDTMYLINKNWSYEDDFYKSANYANRVYAILSPAGTIDKPIAGDVTTFRNSDNEFARKFRPQHSHFLPGDISVCCSSTVDEDVYKIPTWRFRVCKNESGTNIPMGAGGVVANVDFQGDQFVNSFRSDVFVTDLDWRNEQTFYDPSGIRIESFDLSTSEDYWLILSDDNALTFATGTKWLAWATDATFTDVGEMMITSKGASSNSSGGTGWGTVGGGPVALLELPIRRSISFAMWDPKAVQAVQSGLTAGLYTDAVLSDLSSQVKTKDSMYRHLSGQLYNMVKPRTTYNFSSVTAPNIPPFPGDPIVISDTILGLSTSGKQVALTTCGDMTYQWGSMERGNYEAPTVLNIQAVAVHPKYQ